MDVSQAPLVKVKAGAASEVCKNFKLKEAARPLFKESQTPREFLEALLAGGQYQAAVDFLAHALPPREAIWWGCLCLQNASRSGMPAPELSAWKAAVEWVLDPTEESRRAAQARGEAIGVGSPAGGIATAAGWTGGSISPPKAPAVPPGPFMPAKAVAGAVQLIAARAEPVRIADVQRRLVEMGIGVAEGRFVWPDVPREAPGGPARGA